MTDERMDLEFRRKLLHSCFGLLLISILYLFEKQYLIIFLCCLLLLGSPMIIWRLHGRQIPMINWFEGKFERDSAKFSGYGAFWYVVGALILALLINNEGQIIAALISLAFGDSAATIIGMRSKHPLPFNKKKTIEGSLAFFIFSLPSIFLLGGLGISLAFFLAIIEGLSLPSDDNLAIPVSSTAFFMIFGKITH